MRKMYTPVPMPMDPPRDPHVPCGDDSVAIVAAARNTLYDTSSVNKAMRHLLDYLDPSLSDLIRRGDRVLVKVNMGCSGGRDPRYRVTTHPLVVEALIQALLDCGARVSFGDEVGLSGKHSERIYRDTGMCDVAKHTGANLIDFVAAGGCEVRSGLLYPRKYLITNAYFEADRVINAASCRSHAGVVMSGAIKNMFGCVLGLRKLLMHNLFPNHPRRFARAIADIHRVVQADLSFLDLTTVAEGAGIDFIVRPVGLMIASTDPVALDTVAAHAIGYENLPIWTTYYGNKFGLGCNDINQIKIRGLQWNSFEKPHLKYPWMSSTKPTAYDLMTAVVCNTVLRPRQVVTQFRCTGCGDCFDRCPVDCIEPAPGNSYRINLANCVDCGSCLKVCDAGAVKREHVGLGKAIRILTNRLPESIDPKAPELLDPAPNIR